MVPRWPTGALLTIMVGAGAWPAQAGDRPVGVVVEAVATHGGAAGEGLEAGDLLLTWRPPGVADGRAVGNEIRDPFDLAILELEHGQQGGVKLSGFRAGREIDVRPRPGPWGLEVRPQLSRTTLPTYSLALEAARGGRPAEAAAAAREVAAAATGKGDSRLAAWLLLRVGTVLLESGAADEAASLHQEAVAVLGTAAEPAVCALAHHALAVAMAGAGRLGEATRAFRAALQMWERAADGELGAAATHQAWGEALEGGRDLDAAASHFRRALEVHRRRAPGKLGVAEALLGLGRVQLAAGQLEPALQSLERAQAITTRWAPDSPGLAAIRVALGDLAQAQGERGRAKDHYRASLSLVEAQQAGTTREAEILVRLAGLAETDGDGEEAEALYRRAAGILERREPRSVGHAEVLEHLAGVLRARGDLAGAARPLRAAVDLRLGLSPSGPEAAAVMAALGSLQLARGHWSEAGGWLERALELAPRTPPGSGRAADVMEDLAALELSRGEAETAERWLRQALALREASSATAELGHTLGALGAAARRRGDWGAAREWYRRARAAWDALEPGSGAAVEAAASFGRACLQLGELEDATGALEGAVSRAGDVAPGTVAEARAQAALAELRAASGGAEEAVELLAAAAGTWEALGPDSVELAEVLGSLARLLRSAGKSDEAIATATRAVAALGRAKPALAGDPVSAPVQWVAARPVFLLLIDLLMQTSRPEEAWRALERAHSWRLASGASGRELVLAGSVSEEASLRWRVARTTWRRAAARLEASSVGGAEAARAQLDRARRELDAARAVVAAQWPLAVAFLEPEASTLERVVEALGEGTLALSWTIGESGSYLFAIGPEKGAFSAHPLRCDRDQVVAEVQRLRELASAGPSPTIAAGELTASASRLEEQLLAPVAGLIDRADRLVVVPDEALSGLPFALLTDRAPSGEPRRLVQRLPVSEASSLSSLVRQPGGRAPDQSSRIWVFAGASVAGWEQLSPAVALAHDRGLQLEETAGSGEEAQALVGLYPDRVVTRTGEEAAEEQLEGLGEKASVVHFAARAWFDDTAPLESGLLLTLPQRSEAGRPDGLLQAWEIVDRLTLPVFLVVLSRAQGGPCREGCGSGSAMLARAFQHAGAASVLTASWAVERAAALELVRRFYAHLGRGLGKDEALREAQLELLAGPLEAAEADGPGSLDLTHPVHWGGFRLMGAAR